MINVPDFKEIFNQMNQVLLFGLLANNMIPAINHKINAIKLLEKIAVNAATINKHAAKTRFFLIKNVPITPNSNRNSNNNTFDEETQQRKRKKDDDPYIY